MAYDYSPDYLARNADVVQRLVQIAQSREILTYESVDWKKIEARQRLVNNCLASMAFQIEDYRDLRKTIRCWTERLNNGSYRLYVGKPEHKVTGRVPTKNTNWDDVYVPAGMAGSAGEYVHARPLDSEEELRSFVGHVVSLPESFTKARVGVVDLTDEAVTDYFTPLFETVGWTVRREQDNLIVERK